MKKYLLKRLLRLIPVFLGVTILAFLLTGRSSVDAVDLKESSSGGVMSEAEKEAMREELGLNEPKAVQYLQWLKNALRGDFGESYVSGKPVLVSFCEKLPATIALAALALAMRLCRALDLSAKKASEKARARLLTPVAKYWICKRAPSFVAETMECLGGNGFIEENVMPRLYREAPVNAIWEGSGNVLCLDVLRMLAQDRDAVLSVVAEVKKSAGDLPGGKAAAQFVEECFANPGSDFLARAAVERLALLAAAEAMRAASLPYAEAFAATRLGGEVGETYGARGLAREEADRLIKRAMPE